MHPFLEGLSRHRGAPPTILVIFGASGDLTARKLLPALYNLAADNLLPTDFHLVGFGRTPMPDSAFATTASDAIKTHSRRQLSEQIWSRLQPNITYVAGDYSDSAAFQKLSAHITQIEQRIGRPAQTIFYISTPPSIFPSIIQNLGNSTLAARHLQTPLHSKIIIEKPFGRDLASAQALNKTLTQHLQERQVYRIDHYLGKETVQNLLVQRFANSILEPLWNRNYIDSVQITVAEESGVGTRAQYYEESGALRDMIQNHTMQLLALTAMEPPATLDPESIRNEKVKLLQAVQPLHPNPADPLNDTVRAQYAAGMITGKPVRAYHDEPGISKNSSTETYAAMRLAINNWRWQGVPFYIRSGKRMPRRVTEIALQFKRPPGTLFAAQNPANITPNTLSIEIQPDEGLTFLLNAKTPGLETLLQPVKMNFRYATTFGSNTPEAYERLILDTMIGDSTLFIRGDEAEASWRLHTPVLQFWSTHNNTPLPSYPAGSWGPTESDKLLLSPSHRWRHP